MSKNKNRTPVESMPEQPVTESTEPIVESTTEPIVESEPGTTVLTLGVQNDSMHAIYHAPGIKTRIYFPKAIFAGELPATITVGTTFVVPGRKVRAKLTEEQKLAAKQAADAKAKMEFDAAVEAKVLRKMAELQTA